MATVYVQQSCKIGGSTVCVLRLLHCSQALLNYTCPREGKLGEGQHRDDQ